MCDVLVHDNPAALNFFRAIVRNYDMDKRETEVQNQLKEYLAHPKAIQCGEDMFLGIKFNSPEYQTLFEIQWA